MRVLIRLLSHPRPPWARLALAALLGLLAAATTLGLLAGSGWLVDRAAMRPGLGAIAGILAIVEVMAFIRAPLRYAERLVGHDAAFRALTGWRVWLYNRLEPRTPAGWRQWRSGDLLHRAIDDVDTLQDLYLRTLIPVTVAMLASVLCTVVVALILPTAGLILGLSLIIGLTVPPFIARRSSDRSGQAGRLRAELASEVVDLVQGAADLLAFGHQDVVLDKMEETDATLTRIARRQATLSGMASAVLVLCIGTAVVGVTVSAVSAVHTHHLHPVWLAALPLAALAAFESIPAVATAAARGRDVAEAGRRLLALDDVAIPVVDHESPQQMPEDHPPAVVLEAACLRYGADLPVVLDHVNVEIEAGQTVAIMGPSGSGKTSIVNVLLRYWNLDSGRATIGGIDVTELAQNEVRHAFALVDQEARMFAGTIKTNVALGRPDATDDEIERALDLAQLTSWVATLPNGLATQIGEAGAQVSGGQRRRLALARALVAGGSVLILDEPTAGLDAETAERLMADLLGAAEGRSVICVTHRQEDAVDFDQVVVLTR